MTGGVGLPAADAEGIGSERLSLGVAARLSRYLQVLTQAKKMGKETISSQELADYTHVNSTQIRRDLSGFGKFGKRGVGYNVDSLVSQIRKILRTTGKHNIALFGAGNLGQAIAGSDIFADHGFRVVAIFDTDQSKIGDDINDALIVQPYDDMRRVVQDEDVVVGVLAVPTEAAQDGGRRPGGGRRPDHLQLLRGAAPGAARGDRAHLEPRRGPPLRALLLPHLAAVLDMAKTREVFEASTGLHGGPRGGVRDPRPDSRSLAQRFPELYEAAQEDDVLAESVAGELIESEIEIRSGRGEDFADALERQRQARRRLFALAAENDALLAATGTHPWSPWQEQRIIDTEHYRLVEEGLKYVAWRNNTFSLHVHVGVRGADRAVAVCDRLRPVLPELLAISANSPFLDGRDSGLQSARSQIFTKSFPRCGIPDAFGRSRPTPTTSTSWCGPTRSSSTRSSGGACARTTRSAPSRCGSATPRRAPRTPPRWPG